MQSVHCCSDGSINIDFYRTKALQERSAYIGSILPHVPAPSLSPEGRQRLKLFVAAFVVATGAFWVTMLTTPPQTEAAQPLPTINISDLLLKSDMPVADPADAY